MVVFAFLFMESRRRGTLHSKGDSGLACVRLKQKAGADHSRWKSGSNECVEADTQKSDANTDGLVSNRDGGRARGWQCQGLLKMQTGSRGGLEFKCLYGAKKKKKKIRCVFKLSPSEAPPTTSHHSTYTSI